MVVNIEFLGNEPVENVITCMNYKVDKVLFFGYQEVIEVQKKSTEEFLDKYCGVQNVVFHGVSHDDLQSVLKVMRREIEREKSQKNSLYFDITGGESLILVAFGMLAKEFETPIHQYDVCRNKLIELEEGAKRSISKDVPAQQIKFNLDNYIKLRGGLVNYRLHKDVKEVDTPEFAEDVEKLWKVAVKHWNFWNPLSGFLRSYMVPDENLCVDEKESAVLRGLAESKTQLKKIKKLDEIIGDLAAVGMVSYVDRSKGRYRFSFKNQFVKDCLWDGGSILELYTYQKERTASDDCGVGIHIDWDGVIHPWGKDVLNEIDVLSIKDNIPVFLSCKSGKMGAQQSLHALYELETVARRFGGKYAKKVLVTAKVLGDVYMERAEEMGIEIQPCILR